ncbi:MAG: phosphate ABC transporter ATP-binding protein PstB [Melioribacteraceae bacterium]
MNIKFHIQELNFYFNNEKVLKGINFEIPANKILGIIGPSGSGKTTFLRALNRMNDLETGTRIEGKILLDNDDIYRADYDVVALRKKVGMVFAMPVPLPMSIYENVVYGPRLSGNNDRIRLDELVEKSLTAAYLWDEVKDRLKTSGMRLSGGQQQRLCLARVLAMEPEAILLDEPSSGLDPISTAKIEDALTELKKEYTIILVTNNTKQAARVSDNTAFFLMGELIEIGSTEQIFTAPNKIETNDYITGRFG